MSNGTKKRSVKEFFRKLVCVLALCTFFVSLFMLAYMLFIRPMLNDRVNDDIKSIYYSENNSNEKDKNGVLIKFSDILKVNNDVKGWISVPNTKIDYPVLKSPNDDPEYYLYRDYKKQSTKYGSIFLDASSNINSGGNESKNIILHGHHMRDGRMFANLKKFSSFDFYKSSPVFTFNTIYDNSEWKIISIFKTNTRSDQGEIFEYLRSDFKDSSDFLNYVHQVRSRSLINTPVDVSEDDQIVTLSTCSYEFKDFRTVLVARRVRPGETNSVDLSKATEASNPFMPECWYKKYGGTQPKIKTFEEALSNGDISWYKQK